MSADFKSIVPLDRAGYRQFGLVTGGIVAGLFGVAIPFIAGWPFPLWPWVVFGVLGLMALAVPQWLAPVYKYWMLFGLLMGTYVMTPLIMLVVFFGLFMPFGLVMRLFGKDGMARKLDPAAPSYRVPSVASRRENLEKPF
ncbi:MAG: SxtJ family membrane protein [Gammaproteobacteria bacterium]|jgi:hypothetical protein|nr:SxtJ family membrane protein [Gammaproteobacteria bacterium]